MYSFFKGFALGLRNKQSWKLLTKTLTNPVLILSAGNRASKNYTRKLICLQANLFNFRLKGNPLFLKTLLALYKCSVDAFQDAICVEHFKYNWKNCGFFSLHRWIYKKRNIEFFYGIFSVWLVLNFEMRFFATKLVLMIWRLFDTHR